MTINWILWRLRVYKDASDLQFKEEKGEEITSSISNKEV